MVITTELQGNLVKRYSNYGAEVKGEVSRSVWEITKIAGDENVSYSDRITELGGVFERLIKSEKAYVGEVLDVYREHVSRNRENIVNAEGVLSGISNLRERLSRPLETRFDEVVPSVKVRNNVAERGGFFEQLSGLVRSFTPKYAMSGLAATAAACAVLCYVHPTTTGAETCPQPEAKPGNAQKVGATKKEPFVCWDIMPWGRTVRDIINEDFEFANAKDKANRSTNRNGIVDARKVNAPNPVEIEIDRYIEEDFLPSVRGSYEEKTVHSGYTPVVNKNVKPVVAKKQITPAKKVVKAQPVKTVQPQVQTTQRISGWKNIPFGEHVRRLGDNIGSIFEDDYSDCVREGRKYEEKQKALNKFDKNWKGYDLKANMNKDRKVGTKKEIKQNDKLMKPVAKKVVKAQPVKQPVKVNDGIRGTGNFVGDYDYYVQNYSISPEMGGKGSDGNLEVAGKCLAGAGYDLFGIVNGQSFTHKDSRAKLGYPEAADSFANAGENWVKGFGGPLTDKEAYKGTNPLTGLGRFLGRAVIGNTFNLFARELPSLITGGATKRVMDPAMSAGKNLVDGVVRQPVKAIGNLPRGLGGEIAGDISNALSASTDFLINSASMRGIDNSLDPKGSMKLKGEISKYETLGSVATISVSAVQATKGGKNTPGGHDKPHVKPGAKVTGGEFGAPGASGLTGAEAAGVGGF